MRDLFFDVPAPSSPDVKPFAHSRTIAGDVAATILTLADGDFAPAAVDLQVLSSEDSSRVSLTIEKKDQDVISVQIEAGEMFVASIPPATSVSVKSLNAKLSITVFPNKLSENTP